MRLPVVFAIIGYFVRMFSLAFLPPLLLALWDGDLTGAGHFTIALAITIATGTLASLKVERNLALQRGEALAVVCGTWLVIGLFAAIPYMLEGLSFVDSFFESISGFTTTGATILTDFSQYGRAFFLWRAMTQWFGGLGVIALFVVMLPRLGIAGRQLFFAEASGAPSEAVSPQVRNAASRLWMLYCALTVALTVLLVIADMSLYDAFLHALTTMPAGGFSPNSASVAGYANPAAEWILSLFMLLSGSSFPLLWIAFTRRPWAVFRDGEFLFYFFVAAAGALGIAVAMAGGIPTWEHLRWGAFQSTSLISSTGYASVDYNLWPDTARVLLVVVMVVGGCAGSAAGGPKSVRWLLVLKHIRRQIILTLHRRAVVPIRYKGRVIPDSIMYAVITLVALYVIGYFALGVALTVMGEDLVTAFTASLACLGNVGPAFGAAGPMGSFAEFGEMSKLLLTFSMWIGRLEIISVLALLHPSIWRNVTFIPTPYQGKIRRR